jgi:hypothetical protein
MINDMKSFVQNEYRIIANGGKYFEIIWVDSFDFLVEQKMLAVTADEFYAAADTIRDYRREVLRRFSRNQDCIRCTSVIPATVEEKRAEEAKIQYWHIKQLLVFRFYERKKAEGVENLFLELPAAV